MSDALAELLGHNAPPPDLLVGEALRERLRDEHSDLIRRKEREDAFACTFKLLMTHEGKKMGKTERGALWLDPELCSPYEFYQSTFSE